MIIENKMTGVRVNNEIDLCEVISKNDKRMEVVRHKIEAALQYARISYFLRWEEPGLFQKFFFGEKTKLIFCINASQKEDALQIIEDLHLTEKDVLISGRKSRNRYVYENKR